MAKKKKKSNTANVGHRCGAVSEFLHPTVSGSHKTVDTTGAPIRTLLRRKFELKKKSRVSFSLGGGGCLVTARGERERERKKEVYQVISNSGLKVAHLTRPCSGR